MTLFLDSHFQNGPESVILQKTQLFSTQSFKHNSAHKPSLSLTPMVSFEPRFHVSVINGYDRKK